MKDYVKIIIPMLVIGFITAVGCYYILTEYGKQSVEIKTGSVNEETSEIVSDKELKYETRGVLISKNEEENRLTFQSIDEDKQASFVFDRSTQFLSKHGQNMTLGQLRLGDIFDVTYSVHSGVLDIVQISDSSFSLTGINKFEISDNQKSIKIGNSMYKLDKSLVVSYGQRLAKLIDVTSVDTITVNGTDRTVTSIIVEKGHGYLRLLNDSYFLGGWVEVGQEIIKPVTEGMLIPVPEGEYKLRLTNRGYAGEDTIVIERDKETKVDLSEIEIEEVAIGHVLFDITPDYALLFIDGVMTDYEGRVPLEFGVHKVHVECAGHEDVDTRIKISEEYADVAIEMDRNGDNTSSSGSASSTLVANSGTDVTGSSAEYSFTSPNATTQSSSTAVSSTASSSTAVSTTNSSSTSSSTKSSSTSSSSSSSSSSRTGINDPFGGYMIGNSAVMYVDEPKGAQVYVDGVYIGVAPTACVKPTGSHILTLCSDNKMPKSYTINVENDNKDVTYSFSDLLDATEANYWDYLSGLGF